MKFQLKFILPIAAHFIAAAGACLTHSTNQNNSQLTLVQGWIRHVPKVCIMSSLCSTIPGPICTAPLTGQQLYAKDPAGDCVTVVYAPQ